MRPESTRPDSTRPVLDKRLLLRNALRTPDGTILESYNRHDYKSYTDANGKIYFVDGGLDYWRASGNYDEVYLHVYDDVPHEVARDVVTWGTYGINGDQPLTHIFIADMDDDHLINVLSSQFSVYPQVMTVMIEELKFRQIDFDEEEMEHKRKKAEIVSKRQFLELWAELQSEEGD